MNHIDGLPDESRTKVAQYGYDERWTTELELQAQLLEVLSASVYEKPIEVPRPGRERAKEWAPEDAPTGASTTDEMIDFLRNMQG